MSTPFYFIPGLPLDTATPPRGILIKGSAPSLDYGFDLLQIYPLVPALDPKSAYDRIRDELGLLDRLLHDQLHVRPPLPLPPTDAVHAPAAVMKLLNPRIASLASLLPVNPELDVPGQMLALEDVRPFPLRLASSSKLLHTLAWVDANIKLAIELITQPLRLPERTVHEIAAAALRLYCYFVKQNDYLLARSINFNHSMFIQDRILHLIFGDVLYWGADVFIRRAMTANRIAREVLRNFESFDPGDLCALAVSMGVLWTSRGDVQASFNARPEGIVSDLSTKLVELRRNWCIDDTRLFLREVEDASVGPVLVVLDDNGEAVFDLALFQSLLECVPRLSVKILVNRYPVSTNLALVAFEEILTDDLFAPLRRECTVGRVEILIEEQLLPSFEPAYCSTATWKALEEAQIAYVKGANFFETFQPASLTRYYAFVVSGRLSALLTGCPEGRSVFARVPRGEVAYAYQNEGNVETLCARRAGSKGRES